MKTTSLYPLILAFSILLAGFSSCSQSGINPDASGTFETTEILVSAEGMGKILVLNAEEGMLLAENQVVGYIDSTQVYLKIRQLKATQNA